MGFLPEVRIVDPQVFLIRDDEYGGERYGEEYLSIHT
jgi:hypothetical protein